MKVLVSGGNDPLQRSIIGALLEDGHESRVLTREPLALTGDWPAHVEPWPLDPTDGSLDAAARGCDVAIAIDRSVAAPVGTQNDVDARGERDDNDRAGDSERVRAAILRSEVPRIISVTSRAALGEGTRSTAEGTADSSRQWLEI